MDPFVGLGSTAVACVQLGVNFVGVDLDRRYLDEAVSRTREAIAVQRGARPRRHRRSLP